MKKFVNIGLFSFLLGCTACQDQSTKFQSVAAGEFASVIAASGVQRLDVRSAEEYAEGHIAGSLNIDVRRDDFVETATAMLEKDRTVAVYCRSGRRSKKAADLLEKAGFKVVELKGGFNEWKEAHKAVEK